MKRPILNSISTSTNKNQKDRRKLCTYQELKFQHSYYEQGTEEMPWVAVPQKLFIILVFDCICLSLNIGNIQYLQKCLIFEMTLLRNFISLNWFSSISLIVILMKNQMLGITKIKQHILVKNITPELRIMIYIRKLLKTLYLH